LLVSSTDNEYVVLYMNVAMKNTNNTMEYYSLCLWRNLISGSFIKYEARRMKYEHVRFYYEEYLYWSRL